MQNLSGSMITQSINESKVKWKILHVHMSFQPSGILNAGVMVMTKQERLRKTVDDLRLNPEMQLCAKFDSMSIAKFPVAPYEKMGVRVVDNCAEEHIM